jgi:hypothetical protein
MQPWDFMMKGSVHPHELGDGVTENTHHHFVDLSTEVGAELQTEFRQIRVFFFRVELIVVEMQQSRTHFPELKVQGVLLVFDPERAVQV